MNIEELQEIARTSLLRTQTKCELEYERLLYEKVIRYLNHKLSNGREPKAEHNELLASNITNIDASNSS